MIIGDREVIAERARMRAIPFDAHVIHVPVASPVTPGRLDKANARHVLSLLDTALDGCVAGKFDAMVTAPVQKSVLNDAGIPFTGHTEYLAERTKTPLVVMMLAGGGLRVALATTHLALSEVPRAITRELLEKIIRITEADLRKRFGVAKPRILVAGLNPHSGEGGHFGVARPRILVAGLNPHAGESGYLGREEIDVIAPVIEKLKREGLEVSGPYPADTLFTPRVLATGDAALAMFHDQGLPVLKHAAFGAAVNVTLGLPIIRTSVDHGTALDRAGNGEVDAGSLREAIALAFEMAARKA